MSQVALRVGEQAAVHVELNGFTLGFQGLRTQVNQVIQFLDEAIHVARETVAQARHIDCDDTDGARQFCGTEEAIAALEQFAQVQLQAAAHRADHVGIQVGINEVLEVGKAVLRGHLEKRVNIFTLPIKIGSHVVGRNRESEDTAICVSPRHDLNECAVNEVHFLLELAISKVHNFVANEGVLIGQIIRAGPVKGEIREGALAAPARRNVEVVDQFLHALDDLLVGHVVQANEGGHVGIKGGEGLRSRPFILQSPKEVHDLSARRREVLRGCRGDGTADPVETFLDQSLERPSRAVTREHIEIVDVDVTAAVCCSCFRRVDALQPVVSNHLAGRVQD